MKLRVCCLSLPAPHKNVNYVFRRIWLKMESFVWTTQDSPGGTQEASQWYRPLTFRAAGTHSWASPHVSCLDEAKLTKSATDKENKEWFPGSAQTKSLKASFLNCDADLQ